jgi:hypothetical protein
VPRKIRNSKHRGALDSSALAWLRGHHNTGSFFKFKPDDELEALWLEHGDTETMFWRRGSQSLPITLEKLEAYEDIWLGNVADNEYGFNAGFIFKNYTDEEKQTLWSERGDADSMYWRPEMFKPLPLAV